MEQSYQDVLLGYVGRLQSHIHIISDTSQMDETKMREVIGLCTVALLGAVSVTLSILSPSYFLGFSIVLFVVVNTLDWYAKKPSRPATRDDIQDLVKRFTRAPPQEPPISQETDAI